MADKRKREHEEQILYAGIVAAAIYNTVPGRQEGDHVWSAMDFLAGPEDEDEEDDRNKGTTMVAPEVLRDLIKAWATE